MVFEERNLAVEGGVELISSGVEEVPACEVVVDSREGQLVLLILELNVGVGFPR